MRQRFLGSALAVLIGGGAVWSQPEDPAGTGHAREVAEGWTSAQDTKGGGSTPRKDKKPGEPGKPAKAGEPVEAKSKAGEPVEARPATPADPALPPAGAALPPAGAGPCPPVDAGWQGTAGGPQGAVGSRLGGLLGWDGQGPCGPPYRYWASAEYLLWWTKDDRVPPLVTAAFPPDAGVLGQPSTVVLYGGDIDSDARSGVRLTAGMWLDDCRRLGVEASTFGLLADRDEFDASSQGVPVLARPFFDAATGAPGSELVAFPGLLAGGVSVDTYSKLKGCEANAICNLKCCYACCGGCDGCGGCFWQGGRLDALVGVRYLELRESLTIRETIVVPAGVPVLGTFPNIGGLPLVGGAQFGVQDRFRTENRFYGAQVGLRGEYMFADGLFVNATGKVAAGVMEQRVEIEGSTAVVTPAGSVIGPGGLLTQTTNIGDYDRSRFATVTELNLNVGYQVDQNLRVFVGYTYLGVTNVARPGDQIDFVVNSTRVPTSLVPAAGPLRPAFRMRDSDFWAQGFSLGAEVRY